MDEREGTGMEGKLIGKGSEAREGEVSG